MNVYLNFACFVKIIYDQGSEELFCVSNNVIMVTNMQSTRTADNKDWDLVGWYHHGACNGLILSAGRNWFLHPLWPRHGCELPYDTKPNHTKVRYYQSIPFHIIQHILILNIKRTIPCQVLSKQHHYHKTQRDRKASGTWDAPELVVGVTSIRSTSTYTTIVLHKS